jgi:hypothetical protein
VKAVPLEKIRHAGATTVVLSTVKAVRRPAAPTRRRARKPVARTSYRGHVWCKPCRHAKDADLAALIAGPMDIPFVMTVSLTSRDAGDSGSSPIRLPTPRSNIAHNMADLKAATGARL